MKGIEKGRLWPALFVDKGGGPTVALVERLAYNIVDNPILVCYYSITTTYNVDIDVPS